MVQLELAPEVEQRLLAAAEARGLKPGTYASQLVEAAVSSLVAPRPNTKEDIEEMLDGLAKIGKDIPPLPDYAYTRESFYEDHD